MEKTEFIRCPVCGNKTRDKIREDTILKNFPLSYYKVVVFIDPLQGLYAISIITILYLFYRYGYDI